MLFGTFKETGLDQLVTGFSLNFVYTRFHLCVSKAGFLSVMTQEPHSVTDWAAFVSTMPTASAALPLVSPTPNAAEPASLGTTYAAAALPQVSATPNAAEPASSGTTYAAAAPPHVSATPNAAEPASLSTTYTAAASPQVSAKPNAAEPPSLGTTNVAATPSVFKATPNAVELASLGRGYAAAAAPLVREPVPFGATYAVAAPATDLPLPSLRSVPTILRKFTET